MLADEKLIQPAGTEIKLDRSLPAPWARSDIQQRQKRTADRFNRRTSGVGSLTRFNDRLDASEWLERLLSSLVNEEPFDSSSASSLSRVPSNRNNNNGQRIFQREALPSSLHFVQPSSLVGQNKRRFSLASVRVNPDSLKRQFVYPTPNMALIRLENAVRFQANPDHQENPDGISVQPFNSGFETYQDKPSRPADYSGPAENSQEEISSRSDLDVDVHLNYYP